MINRFEDRGWRSKDKARVVNARQLDARGGEYINVVIFKQANVDNALNGLTEIPID